MSTLPEESGYRDVPPEAYTAVWRLRLFVALRASPTYRSALTRLRKQPGFTFAEALEELGLVSSTMRVEWARTWLRADLHSQFDADEELRMVGIAEGDFLRIAEGRQVTGWVRMCLSPLGADVSTYYPDPYYADARIDGPTVWSAIEFDHQFEAGGPDWAWIESEAKRQVAESIARLRREYQRRNRRVKAAIDASRQLQVERLALRLLKRAGTRNPVHTDRRLCQELGIDVPAWR